MDLGLYNILWRSGSFCLGKTGSNDAPSLTENTSRLPFTSSTANVNTNLRLAFPFHSEIK